MTEQDKTTENTTLSEQGGESTANAGGAGRMFSQDEVNKIIKGKADSELKKMLAGIGFQSVDGVDELKAFNEWKKSQQTEAERAAEREKEYQAQQVRATELQRELEVLKAGVKAEDTEYVIFKVGKMEGEFAGNLKTFLAENKKYTEPETTTVEGMKHKPPGGTTTDGVEAAFVKRNPGLEVD